MRTLRPVVFVCVCLLVAAGCAPAATPAPPPTPPPPTEPPPTSAPDLVAPVKALAEAFNKGDVDAALAPLADDVTWLGGIWLGSATGKERVRPILDYLVGLQTMLQVKDCQRQDDRAVCGLTVVDGCIAVSGAADGFTGKAEFDYAPDGMIRQVSLPLDDPKMQDFTRFSAQMAGWALTNRAEEWAKADKGDKEAGATLVKLCQEYGELLKAPPTVAADPVATARAWIDAMNKGDVEAALALMTDDVKLMNGAMLVSSGKSEARTELDEPPGQETKYLVKDCQAAGDRVECTLSMADACITASGLSDGLPVKMEFILQNGKIGQWSILSEGGEMAAFALWQQKMRAWAKANRSEDWAKYVEYGETKEGDAVWFKLCQEYAESLKAAPTPAADLVAPVKAWVDAINKGDVEAALALFTDEVRWDLWGTPANGKEASRTLLDWLVALEAEFQITNCQPEADRVACKLSYVDGCSAASGAPEGLPAKLVFIYQPDGKITQAIMAREGEAPDNVTEFWDGWRTWTRVNRATDWAKVAEENGEGGALLVETCKEYAETLK